MGVRFLLAALLLAGSQVQASSLKTLAGHTPKFTQSQIDLGAEKSDKIVQLRIWLKLRQPAQLTQLVRDRKFLSKADLDQNFKATPEQIGKVTQFLQTQGLKKIAVSPGRRYVEAEATVADAQRIFQVQMHRFLIGKKIVTANTSDPVVDGEIADSIAFVGGLSTHTMSPMIARQVDLDTGKRLDATPFVVPVSGRSTHLTACFQGTKTVSFSTPAGTQTPVSSTYTGNRYGSDITSTSPSLPPCGYGPQELQQSYGITSLLNKGLDGTGETVVIVDAYGSPTIEADAAAFAKAYGLPPVQLTVHTMGTPITGAWTADQQGWAGETTLDVEYVHAIAPGAKIVLISAASPNDDDLNAALAYAIDNKLGNVISNSWSGNESQENQAGFDAFEQIAQTAVTQGISMHFSSGDSGDMISELGYIDVGYPGSSPLVTSIGGTSLALNADGSVKFHAGWGTNGSRIADGATSAEAGANQQNPPLSPPTALGKGGFIGGAGGGVSRVFAKPDYQHGVNGTMRTQPDIAYLADPYTGVEVVESTFDAQGNPQPGNLKVEVIGGTSLACPMFSGLWAIANQAHGKSLGQAAPLLYGLPATAILDIVPVGSGDDVKGSITSGTNPPADQTPLGLGLPETPAPFYSALYNSPMSPFRWNVITFGTDSTLEITPGYDQVTGLGIPNGEQFINALK